MTKRKRKKILAEWFFGENRSGSSCLASERRGTKSSLVSGLAREEERLTKSWLIRLPGRIAVAHHT
jgi:hypothetical protein